MVKLLCGFFLVGFELQARMSGPPRTCVWPHKPSLLSLKHPRNSHPDRVRMGFLKVVEALINQGTIRTGWLGERRFLLMGSGSKKGTFILGSGAGVVPCVAVALLDPRVCVSDLEVKLLKSFRALVSQSAIFQ